MKLTGKGRASPFQKIRMCGIKVKTVCVLIVVVVLGCGTGPLDFSSGDAETYNNRGNIYLKDGDLDSAMANYNIAIKINPEIAEAYNNRGIIYTRR